MDVWPHCFGPVESQSIMVEADGFKLSPHGDQEERRRDHRVSISPKWACPL
jgi:hypothetical protein